MSATQSPGRTPALARRTAGMRSSKLRELIAVTTSGPVLSLAGGLPPPAAYPAEALAAAAERVLRGDRATSALQYTPTEGSPRLRELLERMLAERAGLSVPAERLIVTTGSQQALDLVAKVLVDPDDVVVVESPAYIGALRAFAAYQPRIVEVATDGDGMDTGVLAERLAQGLRPKLCYLVPNFSNPSGATLTQSRRTELAALADRYGFLVVEDDPYGELRFAGIPLPPIASISDQVLYLGSVSKVIAPGLRVGVAAAPTWLVRPLAIAKQATDLNSAALSQELVCELLGSPDWLDGHVAMLRDLYRRRSEALLAEIESHLAGRLTARRPEGGMFAWGSITAPGVDALDLAKAGMRRGVAVVPADEFTIVDAFPRDLRLSFSMLQSSELRAAVTRLGSAFEDLGG